MKQSPWIRTKATGWISADPTIICAPSKNSNSASTTSSRSMNDAVLVTGADGFIGTHLVKALRAVGHVVFTHSTRQGDIANCSLSFESVGHVFHLAARTFVPDSWSASRSFYEVNLLG